MWTNSLTKEESYLSLTLARQHEQIYHHWRFLSTMHETFFAITPKEKLCFFTDGQYLPSITLGATRMVFPVELLFSLWKLFNFCCCSKCCCPKVYYTGACCTAGPDSSTTRTWIVSFYVIVNNCKDSKSFLANYFYPNLRWEHWVLKFWDVNSNQTIWN